MDDREIMQLIARGDERGMPELQKHYGPLLRYVAAPILRDDASVSDCVSDVYLRVLEKAGQFDPERGSLSAWLTAITRNTALNIARRGKSEGGHELREDTPDPAPTPEERLLLAERRNALAKALKALSYSDRALFYRKYYYMQPMSQIAAELGMTERAAEGRLYRIRKKLRDYLGGEGYGRQ